MSPPITSVEKQHFPGTSIIREQNTSSVSAFTFLHKTEYTSIWKFRGCYWCPIGHANLYCNAASVYKAAVQLHSDIAFFLSEVHLLFIVTKSVVVQQWRTRASQCFSGLNDCGKCAPCWVGNVVLNMAS
jgi:hypothetical protein